MIFKFAFPLYRKDLLQAIDQVTSRSTLLELLRDVWHNPGTWSRRHNPRYPSSTSTSTMSEADWKEVIRYAKLRFDSLSADDMAPEFVDPTSGPPREWKMSELQKPGFSRLSISELRALRKPWWITPEGKVIDLDALKKDHALSAIDMLGQSGLDADPTEAIEEIVGRGYIRVQTYPDSTAFVQGTYDALVQNGERILQIVPGLVSVEIAYLPADYKAPPSITRAEIDDLGWAEVMSRARGFGRMGQRARR